MEAFSPDIEGFTGRFERFLSERFLPRLPGRVLNRMANGLSEFARDLSEFEPPEDFEPYVSLPSGEARPPELR